MVLVLPFKVSGNSMQADSSIVNKIEKHIRQEINNSVISQQTCPIPNLYYFTAYSRDNLAEDPLIPDDFFIDSKGVIYDWLDLNVVDYLPEGEEERINLAVWILKLNTYVDILKITYSETDKQHFEVKLKTNYYNLHPYFGRDPKKNVLFILTCNNGKWEIIFSKKFYSS